jgi:hypothetical protein
MAGDEMIERLELILPSLELEAAYLECEADFQRANSLQPAQAGFAVAQQPLGAASAASPIAAPENATSRTPS